ncbi:hypothetical protein BVG16_13875 [Paenibacillus selenitireducens]|uniref:Uncharacterized protein n=1 Tax=Paenibacillus selenitireducens TaxID=1324314 RepID=A0A1T2XC95_9BACL|nr:hypothetical protein BVG16_13875 [Paenibacillus selenitireducens]
MNGISCFATLTATFLEDKQIKTLVITDYKGFYLEPSCESSIMGEEKPDEELMGKRKSSPRLSTTFDDVDNFMIALLRGIIHRL